MVLPKVLSPSFWVDKCLTLVLQLVLALLLQILYILKGEDVRVTDVKVTVRKPTPSDGKSIIQAPAKATRPARQNITGPDEFTREINTPPTITAKEPSEQQIITGTLTELKPDKIEKIEDKVDISTSMATPIIGAEKIEGLEGTSEITPQANVNKFEVSNISETHEENTHDIAEKGSEMADETKVPQTDTGTIEEGSESAEIAQEVTVGGEVGVSDNVDESSEDEEDEDDAEVKTPLEMKTSHEFTNIKPFEFRWRHGGTRVFVTGDFDDWKVTHEMQPDYDGFVAFIPIDHTKQHEFKFVVDGNWLHNRNLPTKTDEHGNVNNVVYAFCSDSEHKEYAEIPTSYQLAAAY